MYLSCLLINVGDNPDRPRPGRLWLRNLYHVHQRLCMAFPSSEQKGKDPSFIKSFDPQGFQHVHGERNEQQAFLFRIDPQPGSSPIIIVQSARKPDWDYAFQNSPFLAAMPEVKSFNPQFDPNQPLRFRLLANPVRKATAKSLDANGKPVDEKWIGSRIPVPNDKLPDWLARKAEHGGFQVEHLEAVQAGYIYIKGHAADKEGKREKSNRLFSAKFEGILEVTKPGDFQNTLIHGIGPAKAFGFGLLSVAKVK